VDFFLVSQRDIFRQHLTPPFDLHQKRIVNFGCAFLLRRAVRKLIESAVITASCEKMDTISSHFSM